MRTAIVITVSDSAFAGDREDLSGPAVADRLDAAGFHIQGSAIVPDERAQIKDAILDAVPRANLVVTSGGTGIAHRDITPEVTREVCEKLIEGVSEQMRAQGLKHTPLAALSRGLCGTRGNTLILNLPGSPKGAVESLEAVLDLLPHMIDLLQGKTGHGEASAAKR
ncbi:MAG TPA: MogA/MoaB family molybdenum cofactor biosynthesis protein [Terriglobales bacterium]|nr:MogA/MoaB family molybdenum cofactor biosynthesis protein [Terriglobales bacterium]